MDAAVAVVKSRQQDMEAAANKSRAIRSAITTVNAPLPMPIDEDTLLACLLLRSTESRWRSHVWTFFNDVGVDLMMDLVVEGSVTFHNLADAVSYWDVDGETDNARWIREMASVTMGETSRTHIGSG